MTMNVARKKMGENSENSEYLGINLAQVSFI